MTALLRWLESTTFNDWIAESTSLLPFPGILAAHTIGLGLLAGLNGALDLRAILRRVRAGDTASQGTRLLAGGSLALWAAAITAGRLLAYTGRRVLDLAGP
jgi:hypothetical protein